MIEQSTLNSGALVGGGSDLTDGTGASQAPAHRDSTTPTPDELKRGYLTVPTTAINPHDPQLAGGENKVGDPYSFGGMCGRPQGFQR
jgi:hypothetical protein